MRRGRCGCLASLLPQWALLIVFSLLAAACTPVTVRTPSIGLPAPDPTRRLELQGFSIMPPGGGDSWIIQGAGVVDADRASFRRMLLTVPLESMTTSQLFFGKRADLKDESSDTVVAGVMTLDAKEANSTSDLEQQVATEFAMPIPARYRLLRSNVWADGSLGPNCVRYETATEDRQLPDFPGLVFLISTRVRRCLHPQWPGYVIEMFYTERHRQGLASVAVPAEVDAFLDSLRISLERPILSRAIFVGKSPNYLAIDDGDVWVTNLSDNTVSRIDGRTNQVVATIPVGRRPVGVALGDDAVWIVNSDDDTISRIDRRTNRVAATIQVGKSPGLLAFGAGAVWVVNFGGTVSRIDPRVNRTVATIPVGRDAVGIAASSSAVWVGWTQGGEGSISRIDPQRNEVAGKPISLGPGASHPVVIAVGKDEAVWVTTHEGVVLRIDPSTGRRLTTRVSRSVAKTGNTGGLAVTADAVWVTSPRENTLWRLDPVRNEPIGKPILMGGFPNGIALGLGAIWTADVWTGTVTRLELTD